MEQLLERVIKEDLYRQTMEGSGLYEHKAQTEDIGDYQGTPCRSTSVMAPSHNVDCGVSPYEAREAGTQDVP